MVEKTFFHTIVIAASLNPLCKYFKFDHDRIGYVRHRGFARFQMAKCAAPFPKMRENDRKTPKCAIGCFSLFYERYLTPKHVTLLQKHTASRKEKDSNECCADIHVFFPANCTNVAAMHAQFTQIYMFSEI